MLGRWRKALVQAVLAEDSRDMNMEVFEGKTPAQNIIEAAETLPFMAEHRLVIVKDSGLFAAGRSEDAAVLADFVKDIPETAILIFVEADVDKRGRLYKRIADKSLGLVCEAKSPKEAELADWMVKYALRLGKKMSRSTAMGLIRMVQADMQTLCNEIEKLAAYKGEAAEINMQDVEALCVKSLEAKIFDLMKAIGSRDAKRASGLYGNLVALRESPLMVLAMVARQFRFCLQCASLNMSQKDMAAKLGLHPFAVREFLEAAGNFSQEAMIACLEECLETDFAIKSGRIGDVIGVEVLIAKCCALN